MVAVYRRRPFSRHRAAVADFAPGHIGLKQFKSKQHRRADMEVNKHYKSDKIEIDEEYLNSLPEDDIPSDINIIEKEMDDVIKIKKHLFDKWIEMCKPIGIKLLDHLLSEGVEQKDFFSAVSQKTNIEYTTDAFLTNKQLN